MSFYITDDPEAPIEIKVVNDEWSLEAKKGFFVSEGKNFPITRFALLNRNGARIELKGPGRPEPEYFGYRCKYIHEDVSFEFSATWCKIPPPENPKLLHNTSVYIFISKENRDSGVDKKIKAQFPQCKADIVSATRCGIIAKNWGVSDLGEISFTNEKNIMAL